MKKYRVEISGSQTVSHEADTLKKVLEIISTAQGRVSVATKFREIFFGNPLEVKKEINLFIERGIF